MVEFVVEPDFQVGIELANELTQRDALLGQLVKGTMEPDLLKKEIQWRATKLVTNIFSNQPPPQVHAVSARYHSELSGGSQKRWEITSRLQCGEECQGISRRNEDIKSFYSSSCTGSQFKHRALWVIPVQMEIRQQFGNQLNSANSGASIHQLRERLSDKPNEDEAHAQGLGEDRRRAAIDHQEHEAFGRQTNRSILSTNRGSDQINASSSQNHQHHADHESRKQTFHFLVRTQRSMIDEEMSLVREPYPRNRVTTLYDQRPASVSPFVHGVSNQFKNSPNSELFEGSVDARTTNSLLNPMPNYPPRVMNHGQPQPSGFQHHASGPVKQPPRPMQRVEVSTQTAPQTEGRCLQVLLANREIKNVLLHRPAIMERILDWKLSQINQTS